jgi:hypothetical protein
MGMLSKDLIDKVWALLRWVCEEAQRSEDALVSSTKTHQGPVDVLRPKPIALAQRLILLGLEPLRVCMEHRKRTRSEEEDESAR